MNPRTVRILVLEHDPTAPLLRLGDWLAEAGAELTVLRLHAGQPVPASTAGFDALLSLGGEMGAHDDAAAPWLPATRDLLVTAVADATPTVGICLGGQLLAVATGGTVEPGQDGPEFGAYLTAKRDAAHDDPLFAELPMTPDVMHFHHDVVSVLPRRAVLLLSSTGYPHQAWRLGTAAWGLQFHIEPTAQDVRAWARGTGVPIAGRLGRLLDDAEESMGEVWRAFAHRFVEVARREPGAGVLLPGGRLPLVVSDR